MKNLLLILIFITTIYSNDDLLNDFNDEFEKSKVEVYDPLSGYNKIMTGFNDTVFTYVLNPVSTGYSYVIPEIGRIGISNFIDNLKFPIRFTNNLLQLKFQNSFEELGRFLINSTIGIAGLMDPAEKYFNLQAHNEDFGQTLGFYGVGSGFHVVLPFLGPSNLRDMFGLVADAYVSPLNDASALNYKIPDDTTETIIASSLEVVNTTSLNLGQYETIKKDAIELYPFLRDIYEQKREKEIKE